MKMSRELVRRLSTTRNENYLGNGWFLQFFAFDKDGKPLLDGDGKPLSDQELPDNWTTSSSPSTTTSSTARRGVLRQGRGQVGGVDIKAEMKPSGWVAVQGMHKVDSSVEALIKLLQTRPRIDEPDGIVASEPDVHATELNDFTLLWGGARRRVDHASKPPPNLVSLSLDHGHLQYEVIDGAENRMVYDEDDLPPHPFPGRGHQAGLAFEARRNPRSRAGGPTTQVAPRHLRAHSPQAGPHPDPGRKAPDRPPTPQQPTPPRYATTLVTRIEELLDEEPVGNRRLHLAESLIHLHPNSRLAANEIVDQFRKRDLATRREAERILSEATEASPPVLIQALLPLLDQNRAGNLEFEFLRGADVAEILFEVQGKGLARDTAGAGTRKAERSAQLSP